MISFTCPACARTFQTSEAYAGKRGKCPGCHTLLIIPHPPSAAMTAAVPRKPYAPPRGRLVEAPRPHNAFAVVALLLGVVSGTYSSIFNASQILVAWNDWSARRKARAAARA